jgi:hypothetical protein
MSKARKQRNRKKYKYDTKKIENQGNGKPKKNIEKGV